MQINLDAPRVVWSPVVERIYIPALVEYETGVAKGLIPRYNLTGHDKLYLRRKRKEYQPNSPESIEYLYVLYESIKQKGFNKPMPVCRMQDGLIVLCGTHRTACLRFLGYDEIDCEIEEDLMEESIVN